MGSILCSTNNCEVYLDDVVVYSDNWPEHLRSLTEVFEQLGNASLTVNLDKCESGKAVVTYLVKRGMNSATFWGGLDIIVHFAKTFLMLWLR